MRTKPYLLFGTPRTGSTLVQETLAYYLRSTQGIGNLSEYFDFEEMQVHGTLRGIIASDRKGSPPFKQELDERFRLLKQWHGHYCLKSFSMIQVGRKVVPFPKKIIDYLLGNYRWILVERRDLFEQALSWAVSQETRVYYQNGGNRLKEKSLEVHSASISDLSDLMAWYQRIKKRVPEPRRILYYEDFSRCEDPRKWLAPLGLRKAVDFSDFNPPERQNRGDKLRYFKNPEKFIKLYRKSSLQRIHPI